MPTWTIYNKNGKPRLDERKNPVVVHSLEYNGTWMGECFVTVDIKSPYPIHFAVGDYLTYRGDIFAINYDPTVIKKASKGSYGEGFTYSSIKMNSVSDELTRCSFLDYTINDSEIHYSVLPEYSFYAKSVVDLANKLVANLNRVYPDAWEVQVVCKNGIYSTKTGGTLVLDDIPGEKNLDIAVNSSYCWDALAMVRSQFKLNFIIRGRVIIINPPAIPASILMYGKGNGLKEIGRSSDSSQQIITRLRAYGSEKNMPWRYYANLPGEETPVQRNNLAVKRLMLPGFPENEDPYLEKNVDLYGVREASVFFDKDDPENDIYEVYPTIEEMTARDADVYPFDDTRLDEIVGWENVINGDDPNKEGYRTGYWDPDKYDTVPNFTLTIRSFGLNMEEALTKNNYKIVMKDGMCGSRDFPVVRAEYVQNGSERLWVLECNRCNDQSQDIYFPNELYPLNFGQDIKDHFVIEDIELPNVYIEAASRKLERYAQAYLDNNCSTKYTYNPTIDNIWMARQHDSAPEGTSLHDTIKEGSVMVLNDDDLGISAEQTTISQLTIKEGASAIPEYNIVFREKKEVGTIQKIQNQIEAIKANGAGGGSGISPSEMRVIGSSLFLSKKNDDTAEGNIKFKKNVTSENFISGSDGSGFGLYRDVTGASYMESDYLNVRRSAFFRMLTIAEVKHIGGELILSAAACQLSRVEEITYESGVMKGQMAYRCYFDTTANGKTTYNEWRVGDQAYCQTFRPKAGQTEMESVHYYWRLVVGVGENYIDLHSTICAKNSQVPQVDDNVVLLGNRTQEAYRKSAQVYSTANGNSPSRIYYAGIDSFSLEGKAVEVMENDTNGAHWRVGDSNSYLDYHNKTLSIKVSELKVGATDVGGALGDKFETFIDDEHDAPVDINGNIIEKVAYNAYDTFPSYYWTLEECGTNLGSFYLTKDGISYKFVLEDAMYYWVVVADKYLIDAMNQAKQNAHALEDLQGEVAGQNQTILKLNEEMGGIINNVVFTNPVTKEKWDAMQGIITAEGYAKMFATAWDEEGNEIAEALNKVYVYTDENGVIRSGITMNADQINITSTHKLNLTTGTFTIDADNFKLDANGDVDIKGKVEATVFYSTPMVLSNQNYIINTQTAPYSSYLLLNYDMPEGTVPGVRTITLPPASQYQGIEFSFFLHRKDKNCHKVVLVARDGDEIHFAQGALYVRESPKVRIGVNREIKIRAVGGWWIVLQGEVEEYTE